MPNWTGELLSEQEAAKMRALVDICLQLSLSREFPPADEESFNF